MPEGSSSMHQTRAGLCTQHVSKCGPNGAQMVAFMEPKYRRIVIQRSLGPSQAPKASQMVAKMAPEAAKVDHMAPYVEHLNLRTAGS